MKKVKYLLFTCVIALLLLTVASCGNKNGEETKNTIFVSSFNHFVIGSDGDESNEIKTLYAGQAYYLIMRVNYHSTVETDGTQKISANLKLYNITVVEGTLDSANSSESKTITFSNSEDENDCRQTTIDFKIPEHKDEETNMEIKIKLTPRFPVEVKEANCRVSLNVSSSAYQITGAMNNGTTFTLHVIKTKIDAPVISWNEKQFTLEWKHVKYANKYEIYTYESEEPIDIYEVPSQIRVGDTIIYRDISKYVSGEAMIRIRAVANPDLTGILPAENYEPTFSENSVPLTV